MQEPECVVPVRPVMLGDAWCHSGGVWRPPGLNLRTCEMPRMELGEGGHMLSMFSNY